MSWSSLLAPMLAQADQVVTTAQPSSSYAEVFLTLLLWAALFIVPYVLGKALARSLRMPDDDWKLGVIFTALTVGIVYDITNWPPHLGIDLSGGVKLIYELDQDKLQSVDNDKLVPMLADAANKAGGFAGQKKAEVVPRGNYYDVTLPTTDTDQIDKVEKAIGELEGSLSRDLQTTLAEQPIRTEAGRTVLTYLAKRSAAAVDMEALKNAVVRRVNPGGTREVAIRVVGFNQIEVTIPNVDPAEIELIKERIRTAGALEFRIVAENPPREPEDNEAIEAAKRDIENPSRDVSNGEQIVARWVDVGEKFKIPMRSDGSSLYVTRNKNSQVLVLMDPYKVTGGYMTSALVAPGIGSYSVDFRFDSEGARLFGELTEANKTVIDETTNNKKEGGKLGIILDGKLMSAPVVQSKITDNGQITGDFTEAEAKNLVDILNAGRLPAALQSQPVDEESISPELGADTIHTSLWSLAVSTVAVLLFMLFYYRFAGIVADAAVMFNLALVLAFMIRVHAAFTLAGLAGLVLSVGMAVDSNVLIYERMREEKERGAALRMVIRNGFGRAMATIIDTHSTTIITGLVLYTIGTEQLKGFAITLVAGLVVNLFTAVFCARVVFDVAERRRWLTELKMLKLFGETHIDFVSFMKPAITVSVLISVLGIFCCFQRGKEMFDSDFDGGTVVQLVLKTPMTDAEVRALVSTKAEEKDLPDPTINAVNSKGGEADNLQYIIRTSNDKKDKVEAELTRLFGDKLKTYTMGKFTDLHRIEAKAPESRFPPASGPKTGGTESNGTESKGTESKGATTSSKANESKGSDAKGADAKGSDSKGTDAKGPGKETSPKTPDAKGTDSKSGGKSDGKTNGKADGKTDGKSSFIPSGLRPRSARGEPMLLALADSDTLLAADPPSQDKTGDTKSPAAKTSAAKAATAKSSDTKSPAANTASGKSSTEKSPTDKSPTDKSASEKASTGKTSAEKSPSAAERFPESTFGKDAGKSPGDTSRFPEAEVKDPYVGGTEVTLNFDEPIAHDSVETRLRKSLGEKNKDIAIAISNPEFDATKNTHGYNTWTLKLALPPDKAAPKLEAFRGELAATPVFLGDATISASVAGSTQVTAIYALVASILMIVVYIWIRFQNVIFGLGAVVALVHDVLVTVAALAISYYVAPFTGFLLVEPFKISLNVVAALLTICGYSISDTIVIFDRIREVRGRSPELNEEMINTSVNQTLSRTVLTVFTVLLVTLILYIAGGQAIHAFAFTMLIGLISGTYSSVYIAAPVLLWLRGSEARQNARVE